MEINLSGFQHGKNIYFQPTVNIFESERKSENNTLHTDTVEEIYEHDGPNNIYQIYKWSPLSDPFR